MIVVCKLQSPQPTFFCDWKGIIHVDFLQERRTINADYYSNILLGEVKNKIWSTRKTGENQIFFLQDNGGASHCQKNHVDTIRKLKWDHLIHPAYNSEMAPSDFYLFGRLRTEMEGMWFKNNDEVINSSHMFLRKGNKTASRMLGITLKNKFVVEYFFKKSVPVYLNHLVLSVFLN